MREMMRAIGGLIFHTVHIFWPGNPLYPDLHVLLPQGIFAWFGLSRPRGAQPFSDEEVRILELLPLHPTWALHNALLFEETSSNVHAIEAVLNHSLKGLFLFDHRVADCQGQPTRGLRVPSFVWEEVGRLSPSGSGAKGQFDPPRRGKGISRV